MTTGTLYINSQVNRVGTSTFGLSFPPVDAGICSCLDRGRHGLPVGIINNPFSFPPLREPVVGMCATKNAEGALSLPSVSSSTRPPLISTDGTTPAGGTLGCHPRHTDSLTVERISSGIMMRMDMSYLTPQREGIASDQRVMSRMVMISA